MPKNKHKLTKKLIQIPESITHPTVCSSAFNAATVHIDPSELYPGCKYKVVSHNGHNDYLVPDHKGHYDLIRKHKGHLDWHGTLTKRGLSKYDI